MVMVTLADLIPAGLLLFAAGYAVALTASKAEDPKLALLKTLLRYNCGENGHSGQRHAA